MLQPTLSGDFGTLMGWADRGRRMTCAPTRKRRMMPRSRVNSALKGIGLCRTEHMFFEGDRILAVREMILAETEEGRRAALAKLLPMQRQDFTDLFEIMQGLPVTIRLLDPPLHEFLPKTDEELKDVARHGCGSIRAARSRTVARRIQPDARPSWLPVAGVLSGNRGNAGKGDL
jgi:pyruvate,orthophosphate dikinase